MAWEKLLDAFGPLQPCHLAGVSQLRNKAPKNRQIQPSSVSSYRKVRAGYVMDWVGRWHQMILTANGNYRRKGRSRLIGIIWNDTFAAFGAENE